MSAPRVIDLFAGCGGMSLGFQQAGFDVVAAFEYWKLASDVYRANFPDHPVFENDLSTQAGLNEVLKHQAEVIIGGPPCQDFSSAGHRNESLGRADLTIKFMEIVVAKRPLAFVMENVPRIRKSHLLHEVKEMAERSGYFLDEAVLDASRHGVPQARKRYFLFGFLGEPKPDLVPALEAAASQTPLTLRDYFGDQLPFDHYFRVPRTYNRRGVFSIDEPAMTIRGVDRPVPKGYPGHPSDSAPLSDKIRTLTIRERALVQTFPSSFELVGTKTSLNQMIGNAVPVNLAFAVAKELIKALGSSD